MTSLSEEANISAVVDGKAATGASFSLYSVSLSAWCVIAGR
ncbi:hypothetical protein BLSMQ_2761 [Brevibacterium aurantiacum]|uniref:Uncharacterized protein n=1 Tax=Brevibacterium aurantiacum TaxID=273384 RepID=A0A1D7W5X9_BREAU|nr:hypothetical protein BLSMQ_2761 [Brevibacterium aurantiacum]